MTPDTIKALAERLRKAWCENTSISTEVLGAMVSVAGDLERLADRPKEEFAWVIEREDGGLLYYAPTQPGEWSKDHLKACRFARKQDADAVQCRHVTYGRLPVYGTRVAEHGWIDRLAERGEARKHLSDFTDAEIAKEHGQRMQRALGDPRICVGATHPPVGLGESKTIHKQALEQIKLMAIDFENHWPRQIYETACKALESSSE